jgi:YHS domain-containing protein
VAALSFQLKKRIIVEHAGNMMAVAQKRKPRIALRALSVAIAGALLGGIAGVPKPSAATTERVVTNYRTGLALSGYDPVGYFTASKPVIGSAKFEASFAGATWRFANAGNRAAFLDDPEIYAPVFGGYDPTGVARGVAVPGHPEVWLIINARLYLFHEPKTRDAFLKTPDAYLAAAKRQWATVQSTLVE